MEKYTHTVKDAYEIINSSPVVVFLLENKKDFPARFVSENVSSLFGYNACDFINGKVKYTDIIEKDDLDRFNKEIEKYSDGKTTKFTHNPYKIISKDKTIKWVQDHTYAKKNDDKLITHYQKIILDITDRIKVEEKLKKAKQIADTANIAKTEFVANMSHELRTPMTGVIGMINLISETKLTQGQKEYLSMCKLSATSLMTLLNDILDFSKIEAGQLDIEEIEFDVDVIIQSVIDSLKLIAKEKGLKLYAEIMPDVPKKIIGDPARIRQILLNLAGNALKFTEFGEIKIECKIANDKDIKKYNKKKKDKYVYIHFVVKDSGIGIPNDKITKIFKTFTQLENYSKKKQGGSGLGLSICKKLIELMDGKIWVDSELNKGSYFNVLARFKKIAKQQIVTKALNNISGLKVTKKNIKINILLAEDDKVLQIYITNILESYGHNVKIVENGNDVLNELSKKSYDLILMDINMPEKDGVETTKIIREKEKDTKVHIPIIAHTAYAMQKDRDKFIKAGVDSYIAKPFLPEDLIKQIESVLFNAKTKRKNKARTNNKSFSMSSVLDSYTIDKKTSGKQYAKFLKEAQPIFQEFRACLNTKNYTLLEKKAQFLKKMILKLGDCKLADDILRLQLAIRKDDYDSLPNLLEIIEQELGNLITDKVFPLL